MEHIKTNSIASLEPISVDALDAVTGGRLFNTPESRAMGAGLFRTNRDRAVDLWNQAYQTGDQRLMNEFQRTQSLGGRFRETR